MSKETRVYLAYYHAGFSDDDPILLAVCDSPKTAIAAIEKHRNERDRDIEYGNRAKWWREERDVLTLDSPELMQL